MTALTPQTKSLKRALPHSLAAAVLLSTASFSQAQSDIAAATRESTGATLTTKSGVSPGLRFAIDCGAIALVIAAFRCINLNEKDLKNLERYMAQREIEKSRREGMDG